MEAMNSGEGSTAPWGVGCVRSVVGVGLGLVLGVLAGIAVGLVGGVAIAMILGVL